MDERRTATGTIAQEVGSEQGRVPCFPAFQRVHDGCTSCAADDSGAYRPFAHGVIHLDVYGHALDWKVNEDAALGLGRVIAKAVAAATEANCHKHENLQTLDLEVF